MNDGIMNPHKSTLFFYHLQLSTEASWDQSCGNYCDSRNEDNHAICFVYMAKANLQIIGWTLDLKISLLKHAKILEILRCYKYSAWASSVSGIALFLHRLVTPFFFSFFFLFIKNNYILLSQISLKMIQQNAWKIQY